MTLVFYISAHGFGYASRDLAVINAIIQRQPDIHIVIRSSVPRWFIEASAIGTIDLQTADTDTGMAQFDSLRLDEDETARRAAHFYGDFDRRVREEGTVLRQLGASVVVGDIPPIAFAAAGRRPAIGAGTSPRTISWRADGPLRSRRSFSNRQSARRSR
jgi:hypothetical protein